MLQESMRTSQKWRLGTLLLLGPLIALLLSSCTPRSPLDETPIPIGTTEPSMEVPAPVTPPRFRSPVALKLILPSERTELLSDGGIMRTVH